MAQYCGTANYSLSGGTLTVGDIVNGTGPGNFSITAGVLQANSIHAEDMASFGFTGGTLMVGQFLGTLNNQGGTMSPGPTPFEPGSSHITGDYTQSVQGRLYIKMNGTGVFESDPNYSL